MVVISHLLVSRLCFWPFDPNSLAPQRTIALPFPILKSIADNLSRLNLRFFSRTSLVWAPFHTKHLHLHGPTLPSGLRLVSLICIHLRITYRESTSFQHQDTMQKHSVPPQRSTALFADISHRNPPVRHIPPFSGLPLIGPSYNRLESTSPDAPKSITTSLRLWSSIYPSHI